MNWFDNLKIRNKLWIGFAIPTLIILIIGYVGFSGMSQIMQNTDDLYDNHLIPIRNLEKAMSEFLEDRTFYSDLLEPEHVNQRDELLSNIKQNKADIQNLMEEYKNSDLNENEKSIFKQFEVGLSEYSIAEEKLVESVKHQNLINAMAIYDNELKTIGDKVKLNLDELVSIATKSSEELSLDADADSSSATLFLVICILIGLLASITIAFFIAGKISKPMRELSDAAEKLSLGNMNITINNKTKDEIGDLFKSFKNLVSNIKETATAADNIAEGKFDISLAAKSEEDILTKSMLKVVSNIQSLVKDANELSQSAIEGKLNKRADASKHKGEYSKIIQGINNTLDAIITQFSNSMSVLKELSKGNLTVRFETDCQGDYMLMKNSINELGNSLQTALLEVSEAVEATASAANQISSSTEQMAAGAQESSQQAGEVASAVEEMTKTILETTRNTAAASEASKSAGVVAVDGGRVVEDTIKGMNEISVAVQKSGETVLELGKSSDKIGEIVQVIDDIADQTNLLALNAAIEAARAGEQGRGFAVVADEVRKLAERTTKATKEIALMIKQIQKDTSGAVESMKQGQEEVEKGKQLALKSGKSLEEIIHSTNKVADIITQVAAASEEQSSASEQISKNIEGISSVTNESASGIQQIAQATEDLSRLTVNLQNLIGKFKIGEKQTIDNAHNRETRREDKGNLYVKHNGSLHHEHY